MSRKNQCAETDLHELSPKQCVMDSIIDLLKNHAHSKFWFLVYQYMHAEICYRLILSFDHKISSWCNECCIKKRAANLLEFFTPRACNNYQIHVLCFHLIWLLQLGILHTDQDVIRCTQGFRLAVNALHVRGEMCEPQTIAVTLQTSERTSTIMLILKFLNFWRFT